MNKNYYNFLNNKVKSLDEEIHRTQKSIEHIKNENENLRRENEETERVLEEKLHTMNDILNLYKKQGFRSVIAKKEKDFESWCSVRFIAMENKRIGIIDDDGRVLGEMVGDKVQKLRLLMKKLPNYEVSITDVWDETFEVLVRFL